MVIRNLRQKKILNLRVFVWFIVICVGIYFLITLITSITKRFSQTPQEGMYTL